MCSAREDEIAGAHLLQGRENGHGSVRQWHAVLLACLHAASRNDPDRLIEVDLFPAGTEHLAGAASRQDGKLQRLGSNRLPDTELGHEIRKLLVGQRRMMAARERLGLGKQVLEVATPARRVFTRPEPTNRGCIEDLLNAAPKALGSLRQPLPDRLQNLQHRLGVDVVNRQCPDLRAIGGEGHPPLRDVLVIAPALAVGLDIVVGAFAESWEQCDSAWRTAFRTSSGSRPAASADSSLCCQFPCPSKRSACPRG